MLAVFAEFERDLLRERVNAGMVAAQKRGKHCGRPPTARAKSDKVKQLFSEGLTKARSPKSSALVERRLFERLGRNQRFHERHNGFPLRVDNLKSQHRYSLLCPSDLFD